MGKYENFPPTLIPSQLSSEMPQFLEEISWHGTGSVVVTNTDIKVEYLLEDLNKHKTYHTSI